MLFRYDIDLIFQIIVHERFLDPSEIWTLSKCCHDFHHVLDQYGVFSGGQDVSLVTWKTLVWSRVMHDCMYFNFNFNSTLRLREDIVIQLPSNVCRDCGDSCSNTFIAGWWIDDPVPNDVAVNSIPTCVNENTLRTSWPAFVHDCIDGDGMKVRQIRGASIPICRSCFHTLLPSISYSPRFKENYYPYNYHILGRHFYVSHQVDLREH